MRRLSYWLIGLLIGVRLFCTAETQSPQRPDILVVDFSKKPSANPYQELYEKLLYPTVRIKAGFSTGSGVVIDDYILTAAHVVSDESTVTVELFYPANIEIEATVVITDTTKDLALISTQISADLQDIYKARLAPRNYTPYLFHPVYTIGCSLGLIPRPSQGIITYISDNLRASASHWEVSSPILPGNSGGPVFDARSCEVIGIAVWVRVNNGQLVTTMVGIVPIQSIYEFIKEYTDLTDLSD